MIKSEEIDVGHIRQKLSDSPSAFAVIVAGPSGVGKTSMCQGVLRVNSGVQRCVTTTTRPPRDDEVEGLARHFVTVAQFEAMQKRGDFVESAEVHGHFYGATFDAVAKAMSGGQVMLMDVDVQGVAAWNEVLGDRCVTVFVMPPSLDVLAERLNARQSESASAFRLRMENAVSELVQAKNSDYVVVNNKLEKAIADLLAIIRAERQRTRRMCLSGLNL
ncbi:MAG: guanylate kinase [Candidatus Latescibacteria bacterium]|nr:guanylate kinase [Candidatus Latescibacterota bacterium]